MTGTSDIIKEIPITSAHDPELGDLLQRVPGAKTLPQIFINNTAIGGYDQLVAWFSANSISTPMPMQF
jgi:glutaredoxin